jgi:hypothetical protein
MSALWSVFSHPLTLELIDTAHAND